MSLKYQLRRPSMPGRETLARLLRWPQLAAPFAGKTVLIYSGEHAGYWRENGAGYTEHECDAGRYTFEDAFARTRHCGPEKWIVFHPAFEPEMAKIEWNPETHRWDVMVRGRSVHASVSPSDAGKWCKRNGLSSEVHIVTA